jgi:hypothetical protein
MSEITVIFVNGKPKAGKDSFINLMGFHLDELNIPHRSFSSIDPIRDMLANVGANVTQKTTADRDLMSVIGDLLEDHSNIRSKSCLKAIISTASNGILTDRNIVLFLHVREPKIINKIKALTAEEFKDTNTVVNFVSILIQSYRQEKGDSNTSDAGVLGMSYDYSINNSGTRGELYDAAIHMVEQLQL